MAGEKVNWDSVETWQRVLAAVIATGVKVDLKATAKFYGTTYDTLENKFRKIKKVAAELRDEVESGQRGEVVRSRSAPNTPRKPRTPSKHSVLNSVANGRVTKNSPTKTKIKQEAVSTSASSVFEDSSSFDTTGSFGVDPTLSFNTEDYDFLKGINLGDPLLSFES